MQVPIEIRFRDIPPSPFVEAEVRKHAAKLERVSDRITACQVTVEQPHRHHGKGRLYHVRVDLVVPGREIVVSRSPDAHHAHEDAHVAIRDAFDAARRRLQDWARESRGFTKVHEEPAHARVTELYRDDGYGFIETPDGREVYFHRNAVSDGGFDGLEIGTEVRFSEEMGDKGPQAANVRLMGRHHHVG